MRKGSVWIAEDVEHAEDFGVICIGGCHETGGPRKPARFDDLDLEAALAAARRATHGLRPR